MAKSVRPVCNWRSLETWVESLGMFRMELGLDRMTRIMRRLGLEKPPFAAIQILGTNGKGSTSVFVEALARLNGVKTGLFTSPHFVSCRERILVNGKQAAVEDWLLAADEIFRVLDAAPDLTYFEFMTVAALLVFRARGVEVAIFEAGLGGRNDATTAIPVMAQALTPVAMDHAAIIGPTITDIAKDKLAAKRCADFYTGRQFPQVAHLAAEAGARCISSLSIPFSPSLAGRHQLDNFQLAVAVWQALAKKLGWPDTVDSRLKAAREAFLPGRLQFVSANSAHTGLILDGAHNPHSQILLAAELSEMKIRPAKIIFSCLADKNWRPGLAILAKTWPDASFVIPQLANARAEKADSISNFLNMASPGRAKAFYGQNAMRDALNYCGNASQTLITGSFYLLAEFYKLFPEHLLNWGDMPQGNG